jgi:hypothetical protein
MLQAQVKLRIMRRLGWNKLIGESKLFRREIAISPRKQEVLKERVVDETPGLVDQTA